MNVNEDILTDEGKIICNLTNVFKNKNREIDRLNNIIDELEKYIGQEWYCFDNESVEFEIAKNILDKLKELKENSDERKIT